MPVQTPWFPNYGVVRALLPALETVPKSGFTRLLGEIMEATGTPQSPVDWSQPDDWITTRLHGDSQMLALRIWQASERRVNPRYMRGSYTLAMNYGLLAVEDGCFRLTRKGRDFLIPESATEQEIDAEEGLTRILDAVARRGRATRGELLPEWATFLRETSAYKSEVVIADFLSRRLKNLVDRGMLGRDGSAYFLPSMKGMPSPDARDDADSGALLAEVHRRQRILLSRRVQTLSPSQLEHLVAEVLVAMNYEEVTVVGQSGDFGVDVVAFHSFGITRTKEVVQVKHHRNKIQRMVVDQLRGALVYHQALRGTIVSLSGFASGCIEAAQYPGAPPITLIDGETLLDLLLEHRVGVRPIEVYDVDEEFFANIGQSSVLSVESEE